MSLSPALRKAAVFISALDTEAAEAVYAQMSPEDAAKIRSALVELKNISADEQRRVLADFLRQQEVPAMPTMHSADTVTLDLNPSLEEAIAGTTASASAPAVEPAHGALPFAFLQNLDPKAIAAVLKAELPQTVAVVVTHLRPEQAAAVLQELPPALATESLERIAWIDEPPAEIQADLARALRSRLAPHIKTAQADASALARLSAVLGAMEDRQRQRVVTQLGEKNQALLSRIGLSSHRSTADGNVTAMRYRIDSNRASNADSHQRAAKPRSDDAVWLTFEDLMQFNDSALRAVFAAADMDVVLLALTGAEPRLIARILRKLAPREAGVLRHRLEHPGPLRLRDVEQARLALAAVASRLAHEGTIELPATVRFAAAI